MGCIMNIDITTENIEQAGKDINLITNEIKEIFDDTFTIIDDMIMKNSAWMGNSAIEYRADANLDKGNYALFREQLNKFGNSLSEYADETNTRLSEIKNSVM